MLVSNNLQAKDIVRSKRELSYPASVIDLLSGMMGQPPGGFPADVQKAILRDTPIVAGRPGESLPPADIEATRKKLSELTGGDVTDRQCVTHILYPKVYEEFIAHYTKVRRRERPADTLLLLWSRRRGRNRHRYRNW